MAYLSEFDNELIQNYLSKAVAELKSMGLQLEVRRNLQDCVSAYYDTPGHIKYPTTHHPDHVWCHPDNSFWVSFDCAKSGRHAVVAAHRVIQTQSIVSELYTHRAFQDLSPVIDAYDIGLQPGLPRLSGRMGTTGGIVTHEKWRRRGLGAKIARVMQALSIRRFEIDYQYSFTIDNPQRRRFVRNGYGIEHSMLATVGKTPINGKTIGVMLNWSSRDELLDRMRMELVGDQARRLERPDGVGDPGHVPVPVA